MEGSPPETDLTDQLYKFRKRFERDQPQETNLIDHKMVEILFKTPLKFF